MSLILEALRKSEAERRRGQTPDLLTDAMPTASGPRRAPPNWTMLLPVIGAALITLLLVAWWLRPSAEPVSNGDAVSVADTGDASISASATASNPPVKSAAAQRQPGLSPSVDAAPTAGAASTSAPAPALPAAATPTPPAAITLARVPAAAVEPKPALPTPAQVASIEQPADMPSFASPDAPIKLSDLSGEDRARLPTLKVSMHMWAPEAGNRFAIIDGTRVNEGDRVGEAMIEGIQQDSVVLSWHGRQILLPIR